jgi:hypothetical protein
MNGSSLVVNAISGDKKSPQDQGELVGLLKEMGFKEEQVYKVRFPLFQPRPL